MSLSEWGLNNLKNNLQDLVNDIDEYSSNSDRLQSDRGPNPGSSFASWAADNFRSAFPDLTRPVRGGLNPSRGDSCTRTFFVKHLYSHLLLSQ